MQYTKEYIANAIQKCLNIMKSQKKIFPSMENITKYPCNNT